MSDLYVLRVGQRRDGFKIEDLVGMYIQHYDPRVDWDMQYTLMVTDNIYDAKVFVSRQEAFAYYQQVCPNCPTLITGEPNCPLTSWHVEAVPVPIS